MMVVMLPDATPEQISNVHNRLAIPGIKVVDMPGTSQLAIGALGDVMAVRELAIEALPGVDRVVAISRPFKMSSLEGSNGEYSQVQVGNHVVSRNTVTLIAGPCTVESRESTLEAAHHVKAAGAHMLRGGAFKPRTSPFSFQGFGEQALNILAEARDQTGLPIVTELTDLSYTSMVSDVADMIQIGARNMQNYPLLEAAASTGKAVLLKRGLSSTLEEMLMAADYILKENPRVILCERGIRSFETATRFTLDLSAVIWLQMHSHLPVIVDPSHAPGDRRFVPALCQAAVAVGADGLIVETTPEPEKAQCDGPQQLHSADFAELLAPTRAVAAALGKAM